MSKSVFVCCLLLGINAWFCDAQKPASKAAQATLTPAYLNPKLPIDARVADLLSRMTVEEKVGQLEAPLGWEMYTKTADGVVVSEQFKKMMEGPEPGSLYGVLRADPWTKVTLESGLSPRQSAEATNAIQQYAVAHSRLHIPLLLAEECTHGQMAIGATTFPTAIGQGSTWDPELIRQVAKAVAQEARASGGNNCYLPLFEATREPRWSRVEETYGEDPYLITRMGLANVKGFQGAGIGAQDTIAATMKTFVAYGEPEGGHNSAPVHAGMRELQTVFLPPFKAGVKAGAVSLMASYNSVDGVPCAGNAWLLTDLLRGQWGFKGYVVSDLTAIDGLLGTHHVAASLEDAAALSLDAGMDSDLGGGAFPQLVKAVKDGRVQKQTLDRAVGRVLRVKFQLGLFESAHADPDRPAKVMDSVEHKALARQVARESIVLLKNAGDLLPLSRQIESIAVIGPNADNVYNQLGDYTAPQPKGKVVTVLEGIRAAVGPGTVVRYAKGAGILDSSEADFAEALDAVRKSSVAVVVMGGSSARIFDTAFAGTGAAKPEVLANGSDMEAGEGFDRATLNLAGVQQKLLEQIVATGRPVVLALIEGRPLEIAWEAKNVPAILNAWYPGEAGGLAIADVLFGDYNPAGRLTISVPRSVGQLPVNYGQPRQDYIDMPASPQYAFGFGLSYTTFKYENVNASVHASPQSISADVTVDISNTGKLAGDEVAQLYLHPVASSVETPEKALRGFQRVHLEPGQTRAVKFHLEPEDLAVFNQRGKWVVEPGMFEVMVGGSSDAIQQRAQFVVTRSLTIP
jgi:beta-glucosidase